MAEYRRLFVAREGAALDYKGTPVTVYRGDVAEEGSWILQVAPHAFRELEVKYPAPAPRPQHRKHAA